MSDADGPHQPSVAEKMIMDSAEKGEGQRVSLMIDRLVPGGAGIGRIGGKLVFVLGGIPGDHLTVRISRDRGSYLEAILEEVVLPSPARRAANEVCLHASRGECGGCNWAAVSPDRSEEFKRGLLRDALVRIGKFAPGEIPEIRWFGSPLRYRLRSRFHVDGMGRVGFVAESSSDVFSLEECEVLSPTLLRRLLAIKEGFRLHPVSAGELTLLEDREGERVIGDLQLESEPSDLAELICFLSERLDGIRISNPAGVVHEERGLQSIVIRAGGAGFTVSASSFFQANRFLLDSFLSQIREYIGTATAGRGIDLYAGGGFLTFPLLESCNEVWAVEPNPSSRADLSKNLRDLSFRDACRPHVAGVSAEEFLARWRLTAEIVICDPPRTGLSPSVRQRLAQVVSRSLVYVSCDPATLARDLRALKDSFHLEKLALLDLFPGTHHVETIALLAPRKHAGAMRTRRN